MVKKKMQTTAKIFIRAAGLLYIGFFVGETRRGKRQAAIFWLMRMRFRDIAAEIQIVRGIEDFPSQLKPLPGLAFAAICSIAIANGRRPNHPLREIFTLQASLEYAI